MKICLLSSAGGHLRQLLQLGPIVRDHDYFIVINDPKPAGLDLPVRKYVIARSQRDWKFVVNLVEAIRILRRERPQVIISAGPGCIVPFAIIGRVLGCKVIYIETASAVYQPTLTGRIMYYLADLFIYQWVYLRRFFPKGIYGGLIYDFRDGWES